MKNVYEHNEEELTSNNGGDMSTLDTPDIDIGDNISDMDFSDMDESDFDFEDDFEEEDYSGDSDDNNS